MDSELSKLLRKFDLLVNTFIRENLVHRTINDYCDYLKKFTIPFMPNNYSKLNDDSDLWQINDFPLLIVNLIVNSNFKKKKV